MYYNMGNLYTIQIFKYRNQELGVNVTNGKNCGLYPFFYLLYS